MYNVGNLIFDATMVVATLWIVNKYLGIFNKKRQNIMSVSIWILFAIFQVYVQINSGIASIWTKTKAMRSFRSSCWKTAGALRWGIILPIPRPMSHGLAMTTRTASGSMNGGITAATVPLWNRTLRRGCRSTSAFTMSVSSRPRLPAFTSITLPSALWTLGHSPSRPATPRMRSSTTISASRLKMDHFWRGGI